MEAVTSRPPVARNFALPNLLTYARIAAVPAVVACLYWQDILHGGLWLRWVALVIFVAAAVTDVLDGYFARKWGEQSTSCAGRSWCRGCANTWPSCGSAFQ